MGFSTAKRHNAAAAAPAAAPPALPQQAHLWDVHLEIFNHADDIRQALDQLGTSNRLALGEEVGQEAHRSLALRAARVQHQVNGLADEFPAQEGGERTERAR